VNASHRNSGPRPPNESGSSFVAGRTIRQTEFVRRPGKPASAAGLCPREKWICPREKCRLHIRKTHARRSLPHLHYFRAGPTFDLGANIAPNCLGGWNGLEDTENCRSAGGHGNQHVRLRGAQVDRTKTVCPARSAIVASGRGRRPPNDSRSLGLHRPAISGVKRISTWRSGSVAPFAPPCPGVSRTSRSGVAISRSWLLHCGSVLALPSLSIHPLPSECECQRVPIRSGR
jgi:hypothetical protein